MSNLMKFMMTIIALSLLVFLNSRPVSVEGSETKRGLVILPEKKLPV
jgi:hypothetical protein